MKHNGIHFVLAVLVLVAWSTASRAAGRAEIRFQEAPEPSARYTTGEALYVETLRDGRLNVDFRSGDGRLNMPNEVWESTAFALEIGYDRLDTGWEFVSSESKAGGGPDQVHGILTLRHPKAGVRLGIHTVLDGTPVLSRWLAITNETEKPMPLAWVSPWAGRLSRGEEFELGRFTADNHGKEGWFQWAPLPKWDSDYFSLKGQGHDAPFFVLRGVTTGEMFIAHLAWPANWRLHFDKGIRGITSFEFGPFSEAPERIIAPGETVVSPSVHLGHLSGDLDQAVQAMHTHLRRSAIPKPPAHADLIQFVLPGDQGYYMPIDEAAVLESIDLGKEIGAELFILDAYWWDVTGDWEPSAERFPNGLEPLVQHARDQGMHFGLYIEPEGGRGNVRESRMAQAHPEWLGPKDIINVGIPEAAQWVHDETVRLIEQYDLDMIRIDFNPEVTWGGIHTVQQGLPENNYWRYYEGLFGIFDALRREHPEVILQQAAGGGARNDLGMSQVFHQLYLTDGNWMPRQPRSYAGQLLAFPPEAMVGLYGAYGHLSPGYPENFDTILRLSYTLATPQIFIGIVARNVEELTPQRREKFLHYSDIYRRLVRPVLKDAKVYHHAPVTDTQSVDDGGWFAMEYAAPDRSRGWATFVRIAPEGEDTFQFRARGLDPGRRYQVTFDRDGTTATMTGAELMHAGVPVRLPAMADSELLLFEPAP